MRKSRLRNYSEYIVRDHTVLKIPLSCEELHAVWVGLPTLALGKGINM